MGINSDGGLVATAFVKRVRGGSQSAMIQACDGHYYVVKSPRNPQHRRCLISDFLGSALARSIGLPTPEPRVVYVPPGLVPDGGGLVTGPPPDGGGRSLFDSLCFASRVPVDPTKKAIYDCLPRSLWPQVVNGDVALGCWLFDCWTSNSDHVQVMFHRVRRTRGSPGGYSLTKIDHGFCFDAHNWSFNDGTRSMSYWQIEPAFSVGTLENFEPYLTAIRSVRIQEAHGILHAIPNIWMAPGEAALLDRLVRQLVRRAREIPVLWHTWWPAAAIALCKTPPLSRAVAAPPVACRGGAEP